MTAAPDRATMLTFAPMVDSETTRLVLRHYGVPYDEEDHLIFWVQLLVLLRGGNGRVPLLSGAGLKLTGPRPTAAHFDAALAEEARLIPTIGPLAAEVASDWAAFNDGMGTDTAVFAYFHLLPARDLMAPIFAEPVPPLEARLTPIVYPLLAFLFRVLLKLTPIRAAQAADNIRRAFDATDRRIADGRRFLCGDRLTLGDIALAAASAPLLQPSGYGAKMPPVDAMPEPVAAFVRELRQHPTASFVDRLYRDAFGVAGRAS